MIKPLRIIILSTFLASFAQANHQEPAQKEDEAKTAKTRPDAPAKPAPYEFLCNGEDGVDIVVNGKRGNLKIDEHGYYVTVDENKVSTKITDPKINGELENYLRAAGPKYMEKVEKVDPKLRLWMEAFLKSQETGDADLEKPSDIEMIVVSDPPHCGPCRSYEPTVEELKKKYEKTVSIQVKHPSEYPANTIPTTVISKKSTGTNIGTYVGVQSKETIEKILQDNWASKKNPKVFAERPIKDCVELLKKNDETEKKNPPRLKAAGVETIAYKDGVLTLKLKDGGTLAVTGNELPKKLLLEESEVGEHFGDLVYDLAKGTGKIGYTICDGGSCKPMRKDVKVEKK